MEVAGFSRRLSDAIAEEAHRRCRDCRAAMAITRSKRSAANLPSWSPHSPGGCCGEPPPAYRRTVDRPRERMTAAPGAADGSSRSVVNAARKPRVVMSPGVLSNGRGKSPAGDPREDRSCGDRGDDRDGDGGGLCIVR